MLSRFIPISELIVTKSLDGIRKSIQLSSVALSPLLEFCLLDAGALNRGSSLCPGVDLELEPKELVIFCTHPYSGELEDRALSTMCLSKGRSVARHPAMIPKPDSIVDQKEMLTVFQKKSS